MKRKYLTEDEGWVTFYPKKNSSFFVEKAGYFDERPCIHTSVTQLLALVLLPVLSVYSLWFLLLAPALFFGWGKLYLKLPIRTGIEDCESAAWGFNYHDNKIWIYIGGGVNFEGGRKWKTISMPWELTWVRTSHTLKDGTLFNETKKNRVIWKEDKDGKVYGSHDWLNLNKWSETREYIDASDNSVTNATISIREMEWRPLWFKWTKLFSKIRKSIDIEFEMEVGKEKGSWKGGVTGCSYDLRSNETPYECLMRMQKERKF